MTQNSRLHGTTPNTRPSPVPTEAELQEAKRIEKMKAVCSSHHVAGTLETPREEPAPKSK